LFEPGEIISYLEMCAEEQASLQRGMNFRLPSGRTVILMSRRANAPYVDRIEDEGRTIIYEGHDVPRAPGLRDPKLLDQEATTPTGTRTQNGLFERAARMHHDGDEAELVRVYEKLRTGIWVFNGTFALTEAWTEPSGGRRVFKFRLEVTEAPEAEDGVSTALRSDLEHTRVIPSEVKITVYQRDRGKCVLCGATDNLHFDHVLPYSRGGTSLRAENVQLLCARHNLAKAARIE